ncbi:MAG: hypothetical protein CBC27_00835 [Opitutia bacterium TMED67]|nr:MAG: hypothetical protein CBC27_03340 [Opitutae bacterium TMED67]OUU77310.1 MAG: hypothetical protein CBC27_00835 [Opitutae bacterium TMED67]|tara:strand:- start:1734 stop:1985 length:252 start_codon:yes stop_codon:yes gene_type:complete
MINDNDDNDLDLILKRLNHHMQSYEVEFISVKVMKGYYLKYRFYGKDDIHDLIYSPNKNEMLKRIADIESGIVLANHKDLIRN